LVSKFSVGSFSVNFSFKDEFVFYAKIGQIVTPKNVCTRTFLEFGC